MKTVLTLLSFLVFLIFLGVAAVWVCGQTRPADTQVGPPTDLYVDGKAGDDHNDATINHPLKTLGRAFQVVMSKDVIHVHGALGGGTLAAVRPDQVRDGITIQPYGAGRASISAVNVLGLYVRGYSNLTIQDLLIEEADRNPSAPNFKYHGGHSGVLAFNCDGFKMLRCEVRYFSDGLDLIGDRKTSNAQILNCNIHENYSGPENHSQGLYLDHQVGAVILDTDFYMNGWHQQVPQAVATMFNHDIYNHDSGPDTSGPYQALRCSFKMSSAAGPTADAGGEVGFSYLESCSHDPQHTPDCWLGGDRGRDSFHDNVVLGTMRIDSINADVYNNTFISPSGPPVTLDLPHGKGYLEAQRPPGSTVNIYNNKVVGWTGQFVQAYKTADGRRDNNRPIR